MVNRRFLGRLTLLLALSLPAQAQVPATAVIGTPPQPGWSQLTAPQKAVLAPLARDWDGLDNIQRRKWLGIVERYPGMKPEEQQRMQERMREWAALTPEQRAALQPGQHITASGAKGRWIGQSKGGTDVAAWQDNARAFPKGARAYRAALREYLRGLR